MKKIGCKAISINNPRAMELTDEQGNCFMQDHVLCERSVRPHARIDEFCDYGDWNQLCHVCLVDVWNG